MKMEDGVNRPNACWN